MTYFRRQYLLAVCAALATAACTESLSLEGTGQARILMQRESAPLLQQSPSWTEDSEQVAVAPDTVASLLVTVTSVQFLRLGVTDTSDASPAWTTVHLASPVTIDLMALSGDSSLLITQGSVAAGAYGRVRLFVTNPRIVFKGDITIGVARVFQGGVEYAVEIPSGGQTGIKTDISFEVEANATSDAHLVFNEGATFANVAATGNGRVVLAPVIRAR